MRAYASHHFDSHLGRLLAAIVVAFALILLLGCGGSEQVPFEAYLHELDGEASLVSADELLLGQYDIASALPVPESLFAEDDQEPEPLWVQIKFQLYAIVPPNEKQAVVAACERHRGMLDDTVVTVCRESTKEELDDSRWATLKSRLLDQIRPILGEERVRQLAFSDFEWTPL